MTISPEKLQRAREALEALQQLRKTYEDVLVVLDYVSVTDIAKYESDSDDGARADSVLTDEEIESVLWRIGKHVGSSETSVNLLPSMIQFALDEHERRELQK
jgi:hypothetical protein